MTDICPYPGPLKEGASGPAVTAVQTALHIVGARRHKVDPTEELLRLGPATGDFGAATGLQCGHLQEVWGLVKTNTFGPQLHNEFCERKAYNDYACGLLRELDHHDAVDRFYVELNRMQHNTAGYLMNQTRRAGWSYHMDGLRFSIVRNGTDFDTVPNAKEDCSSGGATQILIARRRVGLPDPQWWTDHGVGCYTGNLIDYGRPINVRNVVIGDRVHYANNSHLGVVMGKVQGIIAVWSFGGEPGPLPRPLTYRGITAIRRDTE